MKESVPPGHSDFRFQSCSKSRKFQGVFLVLGKAFKLEKFEGTLTLKINSLELISVL